MGEKFVGSTTFRTTGQFLVRPQTLWPAAAQLEMLYTSPGGKTEGTETPNCPRTGDRSVTQERCPDVKVDEASWFPWPLTATGLLPEVIFAERVCPVHLAFRPPHL